MMLRSNFATGIALLGVILTFSSVVVDAMQLDGEITVPANDVKVFGKFVYDYNAACFPPAVCGTDQFPGELVFLLHTFLTWYPLL